MKKKLNGFLKNKKGFSLVECVVALLLFSIITGSVITVFISSRNQIKKQNDNHKLDILASNILSAYEASESFEDFKRILNSDLKIDIGNPGSQKETVPLGKGSGAGSIPIALPYQKILVNNGTASFLDNNGSAILSFNGGYNRNKLSEGDNGDIPGQKYSKTNYTQMVIKGNVSPAIVTLASLPKYYTYTIYKNGESKGINVKISNKVGDTYIERSSFEYNSLSDFEEYLLDNGYYLKYIDLEKIYKSGKLKIDKNLEKYNYYFQVYDATKTGDNNSSCTPINVNGKNLYYCFTIAKNNYGDNTNAMQCQTKIDSLDEGGFNSEKMKLILSNTTITYATGNKCPDYSNFTQELKINGNKFMGDWHFFPWIFYKVSNLHLTDAKDSIYCEKYSNYNEYTPTDDYKSIYYALANGNNIDLINTNGDRMFSFNASGKTNPLKDANCILKDIESTKKYKDADWDLYYKKGSMLQQQISHIEFNNKVATVYDSNGAAFIRFIYKNNKFDSDKASVLSGDYKKYYNISGNTATVKDEYKGDIFFSCIKFDGEYSITTKSEDNDPIFVSNADNFEIIGAVENSDLSYGVIGQPYVGEVDSQTYYITCGLENVKRKLIVKVTFTNLAKVKQNDAAVFIEPRIYIWSVDGAKIVNNSLEGLQQLSTTTNVKLEYSYRKG